MGQSVMSPDEVASAIASGQVDPAALLPAIIAAMSPEYVAPQRGVIESAPSIEAAPGSRLDQLTALYAEHKPKLAELEKTVKEITDAIKVVALMEMPKVGATDSVDIRSASLDRPLRFYSYDKTTVSGKTLKETHPAVYAEVAKTTTVWTLRSVSG